MIDLGTIMYIFFCNKCSGLGGYVRHCQCVADKNCPDCHGNGNYWNLCNKCSGAGIIEIKLYRINDNKMSLNEIEGHS